MKKSYLQNGPKVLTFDIETGGGVNGLKPDLSVALTIGYKWAHEDKSHCLSVLDYGDPNKKKVSDWDKEMLKDFLDVAAEADLLVGHFAGAFDRKYISSRHLIHRLPPLPPIPLIDTCQEARNITNLSSKKLGYLLKVLKLKSQKLDKNWPEGWNEVVRNPKKHVGEMIPYCKGDVEGTEELFFLLLPFMKSKGIHKYFYGGPEQCPKCHGLNYQKRGKYLLVGQEFQRYQCQDCGAWYRSSEGIKSKKSGTRDL